MKLAALTTLLGLASLALSQNAAAPVCPTATRTIQNRGCNKSCALSDCTFQTTLPNPCGCPASVPTATLIAPCEADCPYQGCAIDIRTSAVPCTTTSTSTSRSTRPTTTTTTPRSTGIVTSVITLPTRTTTSTTLPCPRVTRTTSPADCPTIRCPVPTCRVSETTVVPCGCTPRTVLYVTGCRTECEGGCLTRGVTSSVAC